MILRLPLTDMSAQVDPTEGEFAVGLASLSMDPLEDVNMPDGVVGSR
jgi:hypothetical protein